MRHKRNLLASLMLSQGVPMILGGDELSVPSKVTTTPIVRTTSVWLDWALDDRREGFLEFVARLISLRRRHPVFCRVVRQSRCRYGGRVKGILWLTPDGGEMTENDWNQEFARCLVSILPAPQSSAAAPRQAHQRQQFSAAAECTSRDDSFQDRQNLSAKSG